MNLPVIGQIRTFQDVRRALENIREWFSGADFTAQVTTIVRSAQTGQTSSGSYLSKSANLSDVTTPATAFNNIKQPATTQYEGVSKLSTTGQTIEGVSSAVAVTPASLSAKIDTDGELAADSDSLLASQKATKTYVDAQLTPYNMYVRGHLADLSLVYIPLSVDRLISGHLADGTAVTIPLVSGA